MPKLPVHGKLVTGSPRITPYMLPEMQGLKRRTIGAILKKGKK
jgi:hypothetical protein